MRRWSNENGRRRSADERRILQSYEGRRTAMMARSTRRSAWFGLVFGGLALVMLFTVSTGVMSPMARSITGVWQTWPQRAWSGVMHASVEMGLRVTNVELATANAQPLPASVAQSLQRALRHAPMLGLYNDTLRQVLADRPWLTLHHWQRTWPATVTLTLGVEAGQAVGVEPLASAQPEAELPQTGVLLNAQGRPIATVRRPTPNSWTIPDPDLDQLLRTTTAAHLPVVVGRNAWTHTGSLVALWQTRAFLQDTPIIARWMGGRRWSWEILRPNGRGLLIHWPQQGMAALLDRLYTQGWWHALRASRVRVVDGRATDALWVNEGALVGVAQVQSPPIAPPANPPIQRNRALEGNNG